MYLANQIHTFTPKIHPYRFVGVLFLFYAAR